LITFLGVKGSHHRTVAALAALAVFGAALTAAAAPAAAHPPSTVASGDGWTVERGAGGYVATVKLDGPLPVRDDAPELVADGKVLGPATESADGLSLSLTTTDAVVARARHVTWAWASQNGGAGPAQPGAPGTGPAATEDSGPTLSDDPTTPGRYPYTEAVYNFGAQAMPLANIGGIRGEVEGKIYLPRSGHAHPLIIFLHGRHSSCYKSDPSAPTASGWPCPTGYTEIPSYAGYDGAGEALASKGYTVVSVGADAINSNDNQLAPDFGAVARGQLVLDTLTWLKRADAGQPVRFHDAATDRTVDLGEALAGSGLRASSLVNTMNFDDIGLMGHSRGGEGVVTAGTLNEGLAHPWAIKSIFALAPIDFTRATLPDVITTTLLPYCDGDVSDQQGQHFYADSRNTFSDNVLRSDIWVMGTDHNFYNSIWTPPYPNASDDWHSPDDAVCGTASPTTTRITAPQQFQVGSAYIAGFFELTLGGQSQFRPMFDGTGGEPPSVASFADIHTVAQQPASLRDDITSFDSTSPLISAAGPATAAVCADKNGRTVPVPLPYCSLTLTNQQVPYWTPARFAPNVPLNQMTHLTWASGSGQLNVTLPAGKRDASRYSELTVSMSPDENVVSGTDMTLTVTDGSGRSYSALMSSLNPSTVNRMPTSPGSTILDKIVLQQAHVPTSVLAAAGLNLRDITRISFTAGVGLDGTAGGGVFLQDLGFDTPGLGTPSVQARPTVNVAPTTAEEGDGPSTDDVAVYLSRPSTVPITAYLTAIGSVTGQVGLAMQPIRFAPGQTCQAVTIPATGDTLPGATPTTSYAMAVSYSSNAVLGSHDFAALVVREDDGVTTGNPAPPVGTQRDVCAEHAALAKPGALAVSDPRPTVGQVLTITGHHYRNGESVAFTIGSTSVGNAIADSTGTVSLTTTVPAVGAQPVAITALGAGSGYTSTTTVKVRTR